MEVPWPCLVVASLLGALSRPSRSSWAQRLGTPRGCRQQNQEEEIKGRPDTRERTEREPCMRGFGWEVTGQEGRWDEARLGD